MDLRSCAALEFLNLTVPNDDDGGSTTAVWFAVAGDRVLALLTDERLAQAVAEAPEVLVGFSDSRGDARSSRTPAVARLLSGDESRVATTLLNEKYGWRRRSFRFLFWFTRRLGTTWDRKDHVFEFRLGPDDVASMYRAPATGSTRRNSVTDVETAGVVVSAAAMKSALDHLTEVAVPLGLRVGVHDELVELSFHDPDQGWWATTACRGIPAPDPSAPGVSVGVTVPRLVFREAIEIAQLDPLVEQAVTVVDGTSVHLGATAIAVAQSWPEIPAPPRLIDLDVEEDGLRLAAGPWEPDEKVSISAGDTHVTMMGALVNRFVGRGIEQVALYLDPDGPLIVGVTSEDDRDARLVLIAPAHAMP